VTSARTGSGRMSMPDLGLTGFSQPRSSNPGAREAAGALDIYPGRTQFTT